MLHWAGIDCYCVCTGLVSTATVFALGWYRLLLCLHWAGIDCYCVGIDYCCVAETAAWSKPDASPGDNPTYMPITEPTYDTIGQRREEREERSFHNPQYGVPDIEMACAYEVPMTTSGRHDGDLTSGGNDGSLRKGSDVGERTFHNPQYGAPRKVAMGTSQTTPTQQKGSLYREPIHVVPSSHPMEYEVPSKTLPT